jgi:Domain of unknown function (DUF5753)/Helix-turn-helix domain
MNVSGRSRQSIENPTSIVKGQGADWLPLAMIVCACGPGRSDDECQILVAFYAKQIQLARSQWASMRFQPWAWQAVRGGSGRQKMADTAAGGPTVLRMILGRQLQALREKAGLSYDQAAEAIFASSFTIRRMEKAEGGLRLAKVKGLLMAYGITDVREIDAFLSLARRASTPGWWHNFGDVLPPWFRTFPGLEEAADLIRCYEPQFVPGLLQTEDYARALTAVGFPAAPAEENERRVALRMARQQLLTRPAPPRLWAVIDETVLRRQVASPEVMRGQIDRLIEATKLPNVTLQVLPFTAGPHQAMYGMFHLFRFPAPELPDVIYGENMTSAFFLDKPEDVTSYQEAIDRISALAAPAGQTRKILRDTRKDT